MSWLHIRLVVLKVVLNAYANSKRANKSAQVSKRSLIIGFLFKRIFSSNLVAPKLNLKALVGLRLIFVLIVHLEEGPFSHYPPDSV